MSSSRSEKEVSVSEFKTHALGLFEKVSKTGQSIVVTKHGKTLAKVIPFNQSRKKIKLGTLADTLIEMGDIVSPLGEEDWNACK